MSRRLDPDEIPDDATAGALATYVGEDIARQLAVRLAALVAIVCLIAGATTDADEALRTAGTVAGAVGLLVLPTMALVRAPRGPQWVALLGVLVVCGALLAAMLLGHAA